MDITLTLPTGSHVQVTCGGQASHTFDWHDLKLPQNDGEWLDFLNDPSANGARLYQALFPPDTPARQALDQALKNDTPRVVLIVTDPALQAIPWEYAHDGTDYIVSQCYFLRGLPPDQRRETPAVDRPLHIVAVPSDPLGDDIRPLNIDGEWARLSDVINDVGHVVILERTRPPTLERLGDLVAGQTQRAIHFMGHGTRIEDQAGLLFENEHGAPDPARAANIVQWVRKSTFLVTLNACVTAAPGPTPFSNLAGLLVAQGIPYALGMQFVIDDADALALARTLYSMLARGLPVEEAVQRARLALAKSKNTWAIGVPVLYTALNEAAGGFQPVEGKPLILEHQPPLQVDALPRAQDVFRGRTRDLLKLGRWLTGDDRPRLVTIHGGGGQGKTALAREAIERFAHAWPGGVWARSLEQLPSRADAVRDLARFLGIAVEGMLDPVEIERQAVLQLGTRRVLIVLDSTETLIEAVEDNNETARDLATFFRETIQGTRTGLLATSRRFLEWPGEELLELGGLSEDEGAALFCQHAPQRADEADRDEARRLSWEMDGHPLSLILLGSAFNATTEVMKVFVDRHLDHLRAAQDIYKKEDHRHRTLYASIDTSVRYLADDLRALLSGLWVFRAPFLPETAAAIFDSLAETALEEPPAEDQRSPVFDRLHALWSRGMLVRSTAHLADSDVPLYRLLPTVRLYVDEYMDKSYPCEALLAAFGEACARLAYMIQRGLDSNPFLMYVAQQAGDDLAAGLAHVEGETLIRYQLDWGEILYRLGDTVRALALYQVAYEVARDHLGVLELRALNSMAIGYSDIGEPEQALELLKQALRIAQSLGDRAGEAVTLNNTASVHQHTGQLRQALDQYDRALFIRREIGDRAGEAITLNNIAMVCRSVGQTEQALKLYEYALSIQRAMGNRVKVAAILNNVGMVYHTTGRPEQALKVYKEALSIRRAMGDLKGVAGTINNMGMVCHVAGQLKQAMELHKQALLITQAIGYRAGEAATLNNMAAVYRAIMQPGQALVLLEQALCIAQSVMDRAGEASILNNMADINRNMGQPKRALVMFERVVRIAQELGLRAGEAVTLNNMGMVYLDIRQPEHAMELFKRALSIQREVSDRAGEATTLHNMALAHHDMGNLTGALDLFEQALSIRREVSDRAGEATTLDCMADLLYEQGQHARSVEYKTQAVAVLEQTGLDFDSAGVSLVQIKQELERMRCSSPLGGPATILSDRLHSVVHNTIAALTFARDKCSEWRALVAWMLQQATSFNAEHDVAFFTAILALLDGGSPELPADHPYVDALRAIQAGIAPAPSPTEAASMLGESAIPADFVVRCIAALKGDNPALKMALFNDLAQMTSATSDVGFKALIDCVQKAFFGGDVAALGGSLSGVYATAWQQIAIGLKGE